MKSYTITPEEGLKLMTDCSDWFGSTTGILKILQWVASRCKAPTLSANVKLEAASDFLSDYFDIAAMCNDLNL